MKNICGITMLLVKMTFFNTSHYIFICIAHILYIAGNTKIIKRGEQIIATRMNII